MPRDIARDDAEIAKLVSKISNAALQMEQAWTDDHGLDINQLSIIDTSVSKLNAMIQSYLKR
jgi:hypothetical protein